MLFGEKEQLLCLYNAVNETTYDNAEELEIVTLENAIYMNMKNDVAFILDLEVNLYEHQATFNPNMPLRNLFYISKELEKLTRNQSLYVSKTIPIPTPRFVVFYNGIEEQPERKILKLSDAYIKTIEETELELKVMMLNINKGKNEALLETCQTLKEYTLYVEKVRKYASEMEQKEAVERAVKESIEENILKEILLQHRSEVVAMSIFEYDEEKELKLIRADEREQGIRQGRLIEKMIAEGLLEEVKRLSVEREFLEEMLLKYNL